MKKIFMRAGVSPLESLDAATMLCKNSIGDNVGNLIYAYSVFRTLMTEEIDEIIPTHYNLTAGMADEINEKYDYFVIPLADAFRDDFMPEMRMMTQLIKKLKIPCIVNGVGLRAPFEPGEDGKKRPFDDDVKEFVKAVLDKSAIVGVRGEITSQYLSSLGFREGTDHTVIGCPSMYCNGGELPIREPKLTKESLISFNASVTAPEKVHAFLAKTMEQFPNHYFLPQRHAEMRLLYTGMPYTHKQKTELYPTKITDPVYVADRVKFFLNAPDWMVFLKTMDLSVGGRMHGNIAATIAGTPCILIPHDARMRELTEYHNLPHIWANEINKKTELLDLVEKLDFQKVSREHRKKFEHYIDFLNKNQIGHIFKNGENPKESPLEQKLAMIEKKESEIVSIRNCTFDEMAERWSRYYPTFENKFTAQKNETVKLKNENAKLKSENLQLKNRVKGVEAGNDAISDQLVRLAKSTKRKIKKILK